MNEHDKHEPLKEKLLEQALDEKLGGKTPPDLSERILGQSAPATKVGEPVPWRRYALAASVLVALCALGYAGGFFHHRWLVASNTPGSFAQLDRTTALNQSGGISPTTNGDTTRFDVDDEIAARWGEVDGKNVASARGEGESDPSLIRSAELSTAGLSNSQSPNANNKQGGGSNVQNTTSVPLFTERGAGTYEYGVLGTTLGARDPKSLSEGLDFGGPAQLGFATPGEVRFKKHLYQLASPDGEGKPVYIPYTVTSGMTRMVRLSEKEVALGEKLAVGFTIGGEAKLGKDLGLIHEGIGPESGGDRYDAIVENDFLAAMQNPLSTFSIDVDTASYSKLRGFLLDQGVLPPAGAVRIEELVNYFDYGYEPPQDENPFAAHVEVAACPWQGKHRLVRVGLKGKEIQREVRPPSNLVFLVDVSGSMNKPNKLPLVREGLSLLVNNLGASDRVAIVVYANATGLVLPSTSATDKETIQKAIDKLQAGGSTDGGSGIRLAYQVAQENFIKDGVNRVILCTDGDFNVGTTSDAELVKLLEESAKSGVFLTGLGFGMGNHNDSMMEKITNKGNGHYGYIDTLAEARKWFVEGLSGTLVTIAKDVKIQIEFNPTKVAAYRLVGYENRMLAAEDFNDDKKDAGEIGAGHTVTALYEVVLTDEEARKRLDLPTVDPLKYQQPTTLTEAAKSEDLLTLKLRYKQPDGEKSKLIEQAVTDDGKPFGKASGDFKFAAAVASFGMLLRGSQYAGDATYDSVLEIATDGKGADKNGYRDELLRLVAKAKEVAAAKEAAKAAAAEKAEAAK